METLDAIADSPVLAIGAVLIFLGVLRGIFMLEKLLGSSPEGSKKAQTAPGAGARPIPKVDEEATWTEPPASTQKNADRSYSKEELAKGNGTVGDVPILLAVCGVVFDVSKGASFYGPEGPYSAFAGHEATYALCVGSFDAEDLDKNWRICLKDEGLAAQARSWFSFFEKKYTRVGTLQI
jgi:membrane-associated progesterone receptor component